MTQIRDGLVVVLAAVAALTAVPVAAAAQAPLPDGTPSCGEERGAQAGTAPSPTHLRVATYNVLHTMPDLADASFDVRLGLVADALADAGADIVGTQESVETANHGNYDQRLAEELATRTGGTWYWCWFQSNPKFPGEPDSAEGGGGGPATAGMEANARSGEDVWSEGVGIVSRYPVLSSSVRRLSPRTHEAAACDPDDVTCRLEASFDSRQIHWNRLDTPFGELDVFATHLAHTLTALSEDTRQRQVGDSVAFMDEYATDDGMPDLYLGDFNTRENSPVWELVAAAGYVDTFRVAEPTAAGATSSQQLDAPALTVDSRIDYVWMRPGSCAVTPVSSEVIGDEPTAFEAGVVWPSDHLGVVTTFAVAGACAPEVVADPPTAPPTTPDPGALPTTGNGAWLVLVSLAGLAVGGAGLRRR